MILTHNLSNVLPALPPPQWLLISLRVIVSWYVRPGVIVQFTLALNLLCSQSVLELPIVLPQLALCWDYRGMYGGMLGIQVCAITPSRSQSFLSVINFIPQGPLLTDLLDELLTGQACHLGTFISTLSLIISRGTTLSSDGCSNVSWQNPSNPLYLKFT